MPRQIAFQALEAISRRDSKVPQLCRIVQIQEFSPGHSTEFLRKGPYRSRTPVVKQILGKLVSK